MKNIVAHVFFRNLLLLSVMPFLALPASATRIAAFGDSITRGYPYHTDDANGIANNGGYIPYLQSKLNAMECDFPFESSATVYNYGYPGELVTTQGNVRASVVLTSDPEFMLIMEGTNDLPFHIGPSAVVNSLGQIVDETIANEAIPILGTLLPRFDQYSYVNITGTNNLIRQMAANENIELAELYSASGNWDSIMTDHLHPNQTGYRLMADVWFENMKHVRPCLEAPIILPSIYLLLLG